MGGPNLDFDCWEWKAVQNTQPGPDDQGTLTITGMCGEFPTDGYTATLEPTQGGINPFEPWFQLVITPPEAHAPDVLSKEPVLYEASAPRDVTYTKVTICYPDRETPRWSQEVEQVTQQA